VVSKKVLASLPPGLLEEVDVVAKVEHRTRTDIIREALRRYVDSYKRNQVALKLVPPGGDNGPVQNMQTPHRSR
jgi:metal-responsive CopG/Arc/MetJ family transcriptional regulator